MKKFKWASVVGSCLLAASLLVASSASARVDDEHLPRAKSVLSTSELAAIGANQDQATIDRIISMASPRQNVQVLLDFDTKEYEAAILVDETPEQQLRAFLGELGRQAPTSQEFGEASTMGSNGVYTCPYTAGPKSTSFHTYTAYYWCGSGYWTGGPLTGWTQYRNSTAKYHLVGPSNTNWMTCPGYATCTISGTTNLGYVSFS